MAEQGSDIKAEVRKLLGTPETRAQARELAYRGIQRSPADAELRLLLAKLFYLDGLFEYATRELIEVQHILPTPSVEKLLEQFTEYSAPLLSRLKNIPLTSGRTPAQGAASEKHTLTNPKKGGDEVVADLDVDLDLFDE